MPAPQARIELAKRLSAIPTCTAIDVLLDDCRVEDFIIRGVSAVQHPGFTVAGPVRTLRFLPARTDLTANGPRGLNFSLIDSAKAGEVLVFDTVRGLGGSVLGDMLALRAVKCGVAAVVTDGAVRDIAGLAETGLPVFAAHRQPMPYRGSLVAYECDVAIQCGGALVLPDDWILADQDSVLSMPLSVVGLVVERAGDTLAKEAFCRSLLEQGAPLAHAYPLKDWAQASFEEFRRSGQLPTYDKLPSASAPESRDVSG